MKKTALELTEDQARAWYKKGDKEVNAVLETTFGKDLFSQKITDRIKTFEDACNEIGRDRLEFLHFIKNLPLDTQNYEKIKIIAQALNEGWKPNWNDGNYKYYPWFKEVSGFGLSSYGYANSGSYTYVGSRLVFRTRELAEYAGKQFAQEYKDYLTL